MKNKITNEEYAQSILDSLNFMDEFRELNKKYHPEEFKEYNDTKNNLKDFILNKKYYLMRYLEKIDRSKHNKKDIQFLEEYLDLLDSFSCL